MSRVVWVWVLGVGVVGGGGGWCGGGVGEEEGGVRKFCVVVTMSFRSAFLLAARFFFGTARLFGMKPVMRVRDDANYADAAT